jgi:hypothetical protein
MPHMDIVLIPENDIDFLIDEIESLLKPSHRLLAAFRQLINITVNDLDTLNIRKISIQIVPLLEVIIIQQEQVRNPLLHAQIVENYQLFEHEYRQIIKILFDIRDTINPLTGNNKNIIFITRKIQRIADHTQNEPLKIWWADFIEFIAVLQHRNTTIINHLTQYSLQIKY